MTPEELQAAERAAFERKATLRTMSWAGTSRWPVVILRETPKRYRVRLLEDTVLPTGPMPAGSVVLVPKGAVDLEASPQAGTG